MFESLCGPSSDLQKDVKNKGYQSTKILDENLAFLRENLH